MSSQDLIRAEVYIQTALDEGLTDTRLRWQLAHDADVCRIAGYDETARILQQYISNNLGD